jgi:putative isomerase
MVLNSVKNNLKTLGLGICFSLTGMLVRAQTLPKEYVAIQQKLTNGWHTYNHSSVLSHVFMPGSFSVKLSLKSNHPGALGYMGDVYPSTKVPRAENVFPIAYSADGSYTNIIVAWDDNKIQIQSATIGTDLVLLAIPLHLSATPPSLIAETGMLWNAPGIIQKAGDKIVAELPSSTIQIAATTSPENTFLPLNAPYLSFAFNNAIGIYTGNKEKTLDEIKAIIDTKQKQHNQALLAFKNQAATVNIIQNAIGWNTIYDPLNKQVITPVSRYWNESFGGPYVLFNWDTFFGAYMSALFNKELAYANAIAICKSLTPAGMIPNYTVGGDKSSGDRSQPPVGSTIVREIYRKYPEKWFLQYVFKNLLSNNRWFNTYRSTNENYLCWGSGPVGDASANTWQAAAYESGLDNAPMYDGVPFNFKTHQMELADVGLQSLYIMDCESLADIALVLGQTTVAKELTDRALVYKTALNKLWDPKTKQYLNYRTDLKQFSSITSPTNFYPLLAKTASAAQASEMVKNHLQNPLEYGGDFIIPASPKNLPSFKEQNYWRGRVWAPLNMLVYLGLRQYNFPEYKAELVTKSNKILVDNYTRTGGHVFENYNGISGLGRNADEKLDKSDNFYSWGALLGFISVIDAGYMGEPLKPILTK